MKVYFSQIQDPKEWSTGSARMFDKVVKGNGIMLKAIEEQHPVFSVHEILGLTKYFSYRG